MSRFAAPFIGRARGFVLFVPGPKKTAFSWKRSAEGNSISTGSEIMTSETGFFPDCMKNTRNSVFLLGSPIVSVCSVRMGSSARYHVPFVMF